MSKIVQIAIDIANDVHRGQYRKGFMKLPYIVHPMAVLNRMNSWQIGSRQLLAACVLHDTLEDSDDSDSVSSRIQQECGDQVLKYVRDLTLQGGENKEIYIDSFHKKDIGSVLLKIADRLCNVDDFYSELNTRNYSYEYFRKADPIYKTFLRRSGECADCYSLATYRIIYNDLKGTADKLETIKNPTIWKQISEGIII